MTRLVAPNAARIALEWRKLEERAVLVRGRVEALPDAHLDGPMKSAENRIALRQMDKATSILDDIDTRLEEHRSNLAQREVRSASAEQDALLATNGIDTERTQSGVGQRHGLMWLIAKKRLNSERRRAGEAWSADFALVQCQVRLRSCLNDNAPGGAANDDMDRSAAKRVTDARNRLENGRAHIIASTGNGRLADLLDAVCGKGDTLRQLAGDDKDRAARMEVELSIALDMVSVSYDLVKIAA